MTEKKIISADGITIRTEAYTSIDEVDLFTIVTANDYKESNYAGFVKSRGTLADPKPLNNNDEIFSFWFGGADTEATPGWTAELTVGTEGEIKSGIVPGYFDFKLMNQDGVANSCLIVHSDGTLEYNRSAIVGIEHADLTNVKKCLKVKVGNEVLLMPLYGMKK